MSDERKSNFTVAKWDAMFGQRKDGKVVSSPDSESLNTGYVKTMEKRMPVEDSKDDLTLAAIKLYIIELHQHCLMRMVELEQLCHDLSLRVEQLDDSIQGIGSTSQRIEANMVSMENDFAYTRDIVKGIHEFLLQVPGYSQLTDQPLDEEGATGSASSLDGTWPTEDASTTPLG